MALARTLRMKKVVGHLAVCALVAGACLDLGGCEQSEKTRSDIDQRASEAQNALGNAQKVPHSVVFDPLTVTNKLWNGNASLRMQRGMPLPMRYEASRGVTLVSAEPMPLDDIANAISAQTGIPIRLSSLTLASKPSSPSPSSPSSSSKSGPAMPVSYEGPLSGLLERLSAYFSVSWRFDGSSIAISRYETRVFSVESMPGTQQINEGMQDDQSSSSGSSSSGSSSGSSSSSGGSSQNTLTQNAKTTMDLKYWDELTAVLTTIVGTQGSVVVSPTMGTVTVTTTPDVMATVSDYISKENKRQSRQIAISVQIYSVNMGKSEDFNVAFNAVIKRLGDLSYSTGSVPSSAAAASGVTSKSFGALNIAILNGPTDPTHATDVFTALSTIGDATSVAQFPMTTLNNHPVSRRVGTDTTYVSSVTQNTTAATTTTSIFSPQTSTVHEGFSLQLTPRILDDGRILLQYSLSLIGLQKMNEVKEYNMSLPVTDNRIFVQQSMLRSGQTLMIGGVDQEQMTQNKHGVGSPDNFLLGGGVSSNSNRFMMFMAITPQVMDMGIEERN